jgi:hypothetical protein
MCDRVAAEIGLSLVRLANFSGTQGIFIPVMRLVNNGDLHRAGFTNRAGRWPCSARRPRYA